MVSGGGARTHRPKGRGRGGDRRNIRVPSPCPGSPHPSALLPLPHTLRAEERTVRARRPVVTIVVCSACRMSPEPPEPRPTPTFTAGEEGRLNLAFVAVPGPAMRPGHCGEVWSEKGRRSLQRSATDHPKVLFALCTPAISTLGALLGYLFGQSQCEVQLPRIPHSRQLSE